MYKRQLENCEGDSFFDVFAGTGVVSAHMSKHYKKVIMNDFLYSKMCIRDRYAPKYATRKGGYTRIVKIGQRKGDAAMTVVLELV